MDQLNQHLIYMHTVHKAWGYACLEAPEPFKSAGDAAPSAGIWTTTTLPPAGPASIGGSGKDGPDERSPNLEEVNKPGSLQSLMMPDMSVLEIENHDQVDTAGVQSTNSSSEDATQVNSSSVWHV